MKQCLRFASALVLVSAVGLTACAQPSSISSDHGQISVESVATGLDGLWGFTFLPNGDILATEKGGQLRLIQDGMTAEESISGVPEVFARGQGGLLDVALHPDFESNQLVYLSYAKPMDGNSTTAVARGRLNGMSLEDVEDIFVADSRGRGHYGSRLAFDNDGYLFISVGDRQANPNEDQANHPAQDLSTHHGTISRIHDDGSIPEDNPFLEVDGAEPSIWSYGHRNPQGMYYDASTDQLWINEHGPQGGDELNLVEPGLNYGWPVIGYGVNYGGAHLHDATEMDGMEQPVHYWVPSIATSGLIVYSGDLFPHWNGSLFSGGLNGEQVARVTINDDGSTSEETLYSGHGRVRDVRVGPDGAVYIGLDVDADDTAIVRLTPASSN